MNKIKIYSLDNKKSSKKWGKKYLVSNGCGKRKGCSLEEYILPYCLINKLV